jgi:hypothetical protein
MAECGLGALLQAVSTMRCTVRLLAGSSGGCSPQNPFYVGVYAYGKSEKRSSIVDGRARRLYKRSSGTGAML